MALAAWRPERVRARDLKPGDFTRLGRVRTAKTLCHPMMGTRTETHYVSPTNPTIQWMPPRQWVPIMGVREYDDA